MRHAPALTLALLALLALPVLLLLLAVAPASAQPPPAIANFAVVDGMRYAALDDTPLDLADQGCLEGPLPLPAGWALAADTRGARLAMMSHTFGTLCLVLADGASYYARAAPGTACGTGQLVTDTSSASGETRYGVAGCARRVLIAQPAQPGDVDESAALDISNAITFRGMQYAALDNTAPTDGAAECQASARALPAGWALASASPLTVAAVLGARHRFGTTCLVLADGSSIDAVSGAACGAGQLLALGATHYAVAQCNRRVLISRAAPAGTADTWTSNVQHITNFVVSGSLAYAVMDNTPAAGVDAGQSMCQNVAYSLPAGWTIAPNNAASLAAARLASFGTNCVVLADGAAVDAAGNRCDNDVNQLLSAGGFFAANWCDMRVLVMHPLPVTAAPAAARTLALRVLLVSVTADEAAEGTVGVARQMLQAAAVPFDEFATAPSAATIAARPALRHGRSLAGVLESGVNAGRYFAIVVTSSQLPVQDAQGAWVSSLPVSEWTRLADYSARYVARIVYLYSQPVATLGVAAAQAPNSEPTSIVLDAAWARTNGRTLKRDLSVAATGIYRFPAAITNTALASPAMYFVHPSTNARAVAAVEVNFQTGRRELHHFFDQATWSLHSTVLGNAWLNWATRGMYQGARRVMLSTQVDDLFLKTEVWDTKTLTHPDVGPAERCTAADLLLLVAFQSRVNNQIAPRSSFKTEMAFNGVGVDEAGGKRRDLLYLASRLLTTAFFWESHTWSHLDLTSHNRPTYAGALRATTYAEADAELKQNAAFASDLVPSLWRRNVYSANAMVTPKISGLFNGDALRALADNGIKYVVGDNSRAELVPKTSLYHGIRTTAQEHGHAGVLIMPRFATEIYYDCATPEQEVSQYNFRYRAYWGRDLTLDEIMQEEATRAVRALLAYRQDPYMFHQANLRTFVWRDPITGVPTRHSLLSLWIAHVLKAVRAYSVQPIETLKHADLAERLEARMALDDCDVTASLTLSPSNVVTAVNIAASALPAGSCRLPLSGLPISRGANTDVTVETYGEETTAWVPSRRTARSLSLSSTVTLA